MSLSEEQLVIASAIQDYQLISINAVAGAGKTTTILHTASMYPATNFILLTYNASLKDEVRTKIQQYQLLNIECHSYHSLAVKYYSPTAYVDEELAQISQDNTPLQNTTSSALLKTLHCLIIDEAQDMTMIYFQFVHKFLKDLRHLAVSSPAGYFQPRLMLFGDERQCIFQFKGADARFLTKFGQIWQYGEKNKLTNLHLPMRNSYRVPENIGRFINKYMLGYDRIVSVNPGGKVIYLEQSSFYVHKTLCSLLLERLLCEELQPDDIFVLANSVKSKDAPCKLFEHALVKANIPCFVVDRENDIKNESVMKGKVVFSTFHQTKGRERKVVIIYGFDHHFFKFSNSTDDPLTCPNILYVACTRAKEELYLIHNDNAPMLEFLRQHTFSPSVAMENNEIDYYPIIARSTSAVDKNESNDEKDTKHVQKQKHTTTLTDLTKFIKPVTLQQLAYLVNLALVQERVAKAVISIPTVVVSNDNDNNRSESVGEINKLFFPFLFEHRQTGKSSMIDTLSCISSRGTAGTAGTAGGKEIQQKIQQFVKRYHTLTLAEWLEITVLYHSYINNLSHKVKQLSTYTWIDEDMVSSVFEYMANLSNVLEFHQEIAHKFDSLDVSNNIMWLFKCSSSLSIEDKLQLAVMAFIDRKTVSATSLVDDDDEKENCRGRQYKLLNIQTGEVLCLNSSNDGLSTIVDTLVESKYQTTGLLTTEQFVQNCRKIVEEINDLPAPSRRLRLG
jgi:hypothetical protein